MDRLKTKQRVSDPAVLGYIEKVVDALRDARYERDAALARVAELEALLETKTALCDELGEALPQAFLDRDIARGRVAELEALLGQARDALAPWRNGKNSSLERERVASRVHAALSEELKGPDDKDAA